jgi:hypothetical protein
MERKSALKSKTLGAAAVIPLLTLIPGARDVVASHPQESVAGISLVFALLRKFTKLGI